jgi:hypothetical protein
MTPAATSATSPDRAEIWFRQPPKARNTATIDAQSAGVSMSAWFSKYGNGAYSAVTKPPAAAAQSPNHAKPRLATSTAASTPPSICKRYRASRRGPTMRYHWPTSHAYAGAL